MNYSSEVRQRFLAPARAGTIPSDAGDVVDGVAEDRSLKIWVRFQLQVYGTTIERVRYQLYGCPHSLAAADLLACELEGKSVNALSNIDLERLAGQIDLPREKLGRLLRIEDALAICYAQVVAEERE